VSDGIGVAQGVKKDLNTIYDYTPRKATTFDRISFNVLDGYQQLAVKAAESVED